MTPAAEVLSRVAELNSLHERVTGQGDVVRPTSLELRLDSPESGTLRLISWVWSVLHETSKQTVAFYVRHEAAVHRDDARLGRLTDEIGALRTYFQHHLKSDARDTSIRERAHSTLSEWCGDSFDSGNQDHWDLVLAAGQRALVSGIERLEELIREFEDDGVGESVGAQVAAAIEAGVPAHEVDQLISTLAPTFGLRALDPRLFREKNLSRWREELRLRSSGDARAYLQLLIERDLSEYRAAEPSPITADELMDRLGLKPGPIVGQAVRAAREINARDGVAGDELLRRVAADIGVTPVLDLDDPDGDHTTTAQVP